MASPEIVDLAAAVETANLQLTPKQRELINKHFEIFLESIGNLDINGIASSKIYVKTMGEIDGLEEIYSLREALVIFNLKRIFGNIEL